MGVCLSALFCGILFGLGLTLTQMTNPEKVLGFLDIAGQWDPSLALVMASALTNLALVQQLARRRSAPMLAASFNEPKASRIDAPLLAGAALFGAGWGLSGICPGPAIAALSYGRIEIYVFTAAMFAGMGLFQRLHRPKSPAAQ
jgi:uncharacterized membrane protein YedE/YeeE